jgi:hypothetical protein
VFLLSLLLEWAIFKRVVDSPAAGIPLSVGAAALLAIFIYGFGNARHVIWEPFPGGIGYIVGGFIVLAVRMWRYRKRVERDELGDTFL